MECINYVNSITRSQRITFNWLELPGFYELFVSYFSLYKGQRTFMEESISCPSVLSMLSDAMDSDSEGGPQQQSPLQAQQRPKPQIPVKYFTACENVLMSIPDMRIINYLIKKAYTTSSVFSISSVASKYKIHIFNSHFTYLTSIIIPFIVIHVQFHNPQFTYSIHNSHNYIHNSQFTYSKRIHIQFNPNTIQFHIQFTIHIFKFIFTIHNSHIQNEFTFNTIQFYIQFKFIFTIHNS